MLRLPLLPRTYPDPHYTVRKIRKMTHYIDENRSVRINNIPLSIIHALQLDFLKNCKPFDEEGVFNSYDPSLFFCFSVFHHIYLNHYREFDLASLDKCQAMFIDFQRFLWEIAAAYKRYGGWIRETLPRLKLFDLKNATDNIEALTIWKRKVESGYIKNGINTDHNSLT